MGDFNIESTDSCLKDFEIGANLEQIVNEATCFKSVENPSIIDHIWVSNRDCFIKTSSIETGLSDFHRLTATVMNLQPPKKKPKVIQYRSYKNFDKELFRRDLQHMIDTAENSEFVNFDSFHAKFKNVVDKHLPQKKKFLRSNDAPFMNKRLRKEIMLRSRRRNLYLKCPSTENWINFKRQRNKCVKLVRQEKAKFYSSLSMKILSDQKKFWEKVKPIFSEKAVSQKVNSLVEDGAILTDNKRIAEVFNEHFVNITSSLKIPAIPKADASVSGDKIDVILGTGHTRALVHLQSLSP